MIPEYAKLLRETFDEFLEAMSNGQLKPSGDYLTYDFSFLKGRKWRLLGEDLVEDELRELTNILNGWKYSLQKWKAWNSVLSGRGEMDTWDIRSEFVDALAHECMLRPSSIRDTFTSIATSSLHQVRLSSDQQYKDQLDGDPDTSGNKPKYLNRRQKEARLKKIASAWSFASGFLGQLEKLNGKEYIAATSDYRNLISHTIAPRFELGFTRLVTRTVVPAQQLEQAEDGTHNVVQVPGKVSVSYGFGGTPPLSLDKVWMANLEQFNLAKVCYQEYLALLRRVVSTIEMVPNAA